MLFIAQHPAVHSPYNAQPSLLVDPNEHVTFPRQPHVDDSTLEIPVVYSLQQDSKTAIGQLAIGCGLGAPAKGGARSTRTSYTFLPACDKSFGKAGWGQLVACRLVFMLFGTARVGCRPAALRYRAVEGRLSFRGVLSTEAVAVGNGGGTFVMVRGRRARLKKESPLYEPFRLAYRPFRLAYKPCRLQGIFHAWVLVL